MVARSFPFSTSNFPSKSANEVDGAIPLTREQSQENEKLGFNRHSQLSEYHPTGEFDIAATEPDTRYELAKIGDSRTASVETRIAAFIGRLRELVIRQRVKAEINDEHKRR